MGYGYKYMVDLGVLKIPYLNNHNCDIVVSLTSYGRRVADCVVYYTLVSLLRQKEQPSRIIMWLSESEWNNDKLPRKLKKLIDRGVEIRYCKEMRSYKKLIPTLKICPDSNILTVDDDIIYTKDTVSLVWRMYKQIPNTVICLNASMPIIKNGIPSNYASWNSLKKSERGLCIFPIGCGGVLYPKGALHRDVMREDVFTKLCPYADDIWFWFCCLLNETDKIYLRKPYSDLSFDALYQYFHRGAALTHINRFQHANDKQFKDLFEYYNVSISVGGNLQTNQILVKS